MAMLTKTTREPLREARVSHQPVHHDVQGAHAPQLAPRRHHLCLLHRRRPARRLLDPAADMGSERLVPHGVYAEPDNL